MPETRRNAAIAPPVEAPTTTVWLDWGAASAMAAGGRVANGGEIEELEGEAVC